MRGLSWNGGLLAVLTLAGAVPLACGGGSGNTNLTSGSGGSGGASTTGTAGGSTSSGDCFPNCDTSSTGGDGVLKVEPAGATIEVLNGSAMPVDFNAVIDGAEVPASWVVDLSATANVDANGLVSATGAQGGEVVLKAVYQGQEAKATITVNLKKLINPAGVSDVDQTALRGANIADTKVKWAYPYDGTVFPKGLLAPEMMWSGGGAGDRYYLHLTGKYVDFEVFTTADAPSRFTLDEGSWKQLTESGPGGPVKLHVARLMPNEAIATGVIDHTWTIANGSLRGTVYYWANSLGRVVRIKPGASAPEDFLSSAGVTGCSTCHAVSANGSTLIIGGDVAESTWDLLTNKPVLNLGNVGKPVRNWAMPAISPNGKVVIENNAALPGPPGGSDGMFDAITGQKIGGTGLDGVFLDMPAFAPNASRIAYVDHSTRGLGVYNYDPNTNQVSNKVDLVPQGNDDSLKAIAFPSMSPDAKWIVYHRGYYPQSLDTRTGPGNLYLASADQPSVEIRLANANGDSYPFAAEERDRNYNYEPTFAPLNAGGYSWVVFTSRRTYGNRLTGVPITGPDPAKDPGVKQIWVTAIDQNPQPGQDPSHPAFWIPGQDLKTLNMRGFWALDPCKQVGEGCGTGSECCNQNCDMGVCKDPDPNECAQTGNHCDKDADCCDPAATCINNICSEPPPPQ